MQKVCKIYKNNYCGSDQCKQQVSRSRSRIRSREKNRRLRSRSWSWSRSRLKMARLRNPGQMASVTSLAFRILLSPSKIDCDVILQNERMTGVGSHWPCLTMMPSPHLLVSPAMCSVSVPGQGWGSSCHLYPLLTCFPAAHASHIIQHCIDRQIIRLSLSQHCQLKLAATMLCPPSLHLLLDIPCLLVGGTLYLWVVGVLALLRSILLGDKHTAKVGIITVHSPIRWKYKTVKVQQGL